jgi:hypothetical protein
VQLENGGRIRTIMADSTDPDKNIEGGSADTDEAHGLHDGAWHMLTILTHPDGFSTYVDGEIASSMPPEGKDVSNPNGGGPIDPVGTMRLCGRQKPGDWEGEAGSPYDEERYFMGELAHFSVFDVAMTHAQVKFMMDEYGTRFFDMEPKGSCFGHGTGYMCGLTASECKGT